MKGQGAGGLTLASSWYPRSFSMLALTALTSRGIGWDVLHCLAGSPSCEDERNSHMMR